MVAQSDAIRPPGLSKLEGLFQLQKIEKDVFETTSGLWHPPGGRGLYGGLIMSQSLIAAQQTVDEGFVSHSLQSQFFLLGSDKSPVTYSVARVREGRSYATRTVHAIQEGKCIHLAVVSFARTPSKQPQQIHHASGMTPIGKPPAEERHIFQEQGIDAVAPDVSAVSLGNDSIPPQDKVMRCWTRAREEILHADDITVHQAVLTFLSDWLAITIAPYAHGYFQFPESIAESVKSSVLAGTAVGMLSTLNHSIYFHSSSSIRADEWMLVEVNCPWVGDERCLASAKVFAKDGTLLASYAQGGVFRLRQDKSSL